MTFIACRMETRDTLYAFETFAKGNESALANTLGSRLHQTQTGRGSIPFYFDSLSSSFISWNILFVNVLVRFLFYPNEHSRSTMRTYTLFCDTWWCHTCRLIAYHHQGMNDSSQQEKPNAFLDQCVPSTKYLCTCIGTVYMPGGANVPNGCQQWHLKSYVLFYLCTMMTAFKSLPIHCIDLENRPQLIYLLCTKNKDAY